MSLAAGPSSAITRWESPRRTATGALSSFPVAKSTADAISSAIATTVISSVFPKSSWRPV